MNRVMDAFSDELAKLSAAAKNTKKPESHRLRNALVGAGAVAGVAYLMARRRARAGALRPRAHVMHEGEAVKERFLQDRAAARGDLGTKISQAFMDELTKLALGPVPVPEAQFKMLANGASRISKLRNHTPTEAAAYLRNMMWNYSRNPKASALKKLVGDQRLQALKSQVWK